MNIKTDRELFGYVKNLMRDCRFDDRIDIYLTCPSQDESIGANRFNIDNVAFSESSDHQTNITPQMIDFFRTIVDPFSRDILMEALRPKPQPMEDYLNWDGKFIIAPIVERNPWDYFECEGDEYV